MEKPILYCDCDGVIFNTIDIGFQLMEQKGCDMNNHDEIDRYFREELDWREIFEYAVEINNSIEYLEELRKSGYFKKVFIHTGLSGSYFEEGTKRDIFSIRLPKIKVITSQRGLPKALVVRDPVGNILVDDELKNCLNWEKYGGTAIIFSQQGMDLEHNRIDNLLDIPNTYGYKKLIKTRNF